MWNWLSINNVCHGLGIHNRSKALLKSDLNSSATSNSRDFLPVNCIDLCKKLMKLQKYKNSNAISKNVWPKAWTAHCWIAFRPFFATFTRWLTLCGSTSYILHISVLFLLQVILLVEFLIKMLFHVLLNIVSVCKNQSISIISLHFFDILGCQAGQSMMVLKIS